MALSVLFTGCVSVQRMTPEQSEEVVTIEEHSLTQDEAISRLALWAAETFVDAHEVVQLSDENAGTLVLKGTERVHHTRGGAEYPLGFSMTIDVRDQRVRFTQRIGEPHISPLMVVWVSHTTASEMQIEPTWPEIEKAACILRNS